MNICVPVENNDGMKSKVYNHFGGAPFFAICDVQTGKVEFLGNGNQHHEHGQCNPLGAIAGKSVSAILVGGIDARALQHLNAGGIKAYRSPEGPLSQAIELFIKMELPEILPGESGTDEYYLRPYLNTYKSNGADRYSSYSFGAGLDRPFGRVSADISLTPETGGYKNSAVYSECNV